MIGAFLLLVYIGTDFATAPRRFDTARDCLEAAAMASSIMEGDMRAVCFDTHTGRRVGESSRGKPQQQ